MISLTRGDAILVSSLDVPMPKPLRGNTSPFAVKFAGMSSLKNGCILCVDVVRFGKDESSANGMQAFLNKAKPVYLYFTAQKKCIKFALVVVLDSNQSAEFKHEIRAKLLAETGGRLDIDIVLYYEPFNIQSDKA